MESIQRVSSYPGLLPTLDNVLITSSLFIAGLSFCLSVWVVPNMYLVSSELQLQQLVATFTKGFTYLLPSGRLIMTAVVSRTLLTVSHPDPAISSTWPTWALMAGLLIMAAPYEIYFIFPVNNRAKELKRQVEKDRKPLTKQQEAEVGVLIRKWKNLNFGRVILPFIVGVMGLLVR